MFWLSVPLFGLFLKGNQRETTIFGVVPLTQGNKRKGAKGPKGSDVEPQSPSTIKRSTKAVMCRLILTIKHVLKKRGTAPKSSVPNWRALRGGTLRWDLAESAPAKLDIWMLKTAQPMSTEVRVNAAASSATRRIEHPVPISQKTRPSRLEHVFCPKRMRRTTWPTRSSCSIVLASVLGLVWFLQSLEMWVRVKTEPPGDRRF